MDAEWRLNNYSVKRLDALFHPTPNYIPARISVRVKFVPNGLPIICQGYSRSSRK